MKTALVLGVAAIFADLQFPWQTPSPSPAPKPTPAWHAKDTLRATLGLVPMPRSVTQIAGELVLASPVSIAATGVAAERVSHLLASRLAKAGVSAAIDATPGALGSIILSIDMRLHGIGNEGYRLDVDARGIRIAAKTETGLFYAVQTLDQLIERNARGERIVPGVRIVDRPEYAWRGLHLDVSRHFFPVAVVEKYIDVASRFKLNTFHWHLTDDQGWRIDIPGYPRLVSIGGCRNATQTGGFGSDTNDGTRTCSHYSTSEIRDVVAYAQARHVAVIPEIEGPGHSVEALAAYGYLACAPGPYQTLTYWGSPRYAMCPTEKTFAFYTEVFRELAKLFPAPLIHIGGDETPYSSWRNSDDVAALMRRERLGSYAEVQGYFTRRLEKIANGLGKRIVGWDEVDKAGASPSAIVMAWSGSAAGSLAASHGHDVVMTTNPPLYFDAYQGVREFEPTAIGGLTTLKDVYDYDPAASIQPSRRRHILGAQGNVWSEYIPRSSQLWYMTYPRALALAELCWTPRARMDWQSFRKRAGIALERLEPLGVTFRIPEVTIRAASRTVTIDSLVPNATIRYTVDGSLPTRTSPEYTHPLTFARTMLPVRIMAIATIRGYRPSAPSFLTLPRR